MANTRLGQMYRNAAKRCRDEGVPLDDSPNGAIHQWCVRNCKMREGTEFFIVLGICCAMADLEAQAEGYENQSDRAAAIAFGR